LGLIERRYPRDTGASLEGMDTGELDGLTRF
jgi:hypothetical protein